MEKIVFTGGGTLGHVKPCLSVIEALDNKKVYFIGSNGIEKDYIKKKKIEYYEIETVKFIRGKFFANLLIPFKLMKSVKQAKEILKKINPDVVFSKGGYVALPVVIASKKMKIPVIAHESDSSFGLANKIILKYCSKMLVNFPKLTDKSKKVELIGPIISKEFYNITEPKEKLDLDEKKPTILIMGGSLGAKSINEIIYSSLEKLKDYNIIHITGKGKSKKIKQINYNQLEFSFDLANLIAKSDVVISRAGANSIFECLILKKPLILIPLSNSSSRGDQMENARYFFEKGVARILYEEKLTPSNLIAFINSTMDMQKSLISNIERLNLTSGVTAITEILNKI